MFCANLNNLGNPKILFYLKEMSKIAIHIIFSKLLLKCQMTTLVCFFLKSNTTQNAHKQFVMQDLKCVVRKKYNGRNIYGRLNDFY